MNSAPAEAGRLVLGLKRTLALSGFAGVFLAASGAFDTEAAAPLPRLAYWLAMSFISILALEGAHRLLSRYAPSAAARRLRVLGLTVLLLPLTLVALMICKLLFGGRPSTADFLTLLPGTASILITLQLVLTCSTSAEEADREPQQANTMIASLPLPLRNARIEALQAEDHYVRVYTSAGHALVRMRLRDAVVALGSHRGLRPHRSWWVAEQSVTALRRSGGRASLTLVSGQQVPVSRDVARKLGPDFDVGSMGTRGK